MQAFRRLENQTKIKVKRVVFYTAETVEADAISAVPVDLGDLRNSISMAPMDEGFRFSVFATAKYAAYVEFGTGPNTVVPAGLETYAMQWYVNGKGTLHPRPFLFPAYERARVKFVGELKKVLGQ